MSVLAIYAAAVGTASLVWQIYRETRRLRTDLRVEVEHAAEHRYMPMAILGDPDTRPEPLEYQLTVVVINDGEARRVLDVDVAHVLGRLAMWFVRTLAWMGIVLSQGFRGYARLASGRVIRSKLEHLDANLLEHIVEYNRSARP